MSDSRLTILVISNFTVAGFGALARNDAEEPQLDVESAPISRLFSQPAHGAEADHAVVWTLPEMVLPAFKKFMDTRSVAIDVILAEVDEFCAAIERLASQFKLVFLPTWTVPETAHEPRLLDLSPEGGVGYFLMRMNLRLSERFPGNTRVVVLNSARWLEEAGRNAFNPKLWHLAKIPFGNEVFKAALQDIRGALSVLQGRARKVILLDLDDTLWAGIVGEVGWKNLNLGGHDPVGEAHAEFQRQLLRLSKRGILLAIVSKNDEAIALEALASHPEMILRREHFAAHRINWNDKAGNIAGILAELNLPASAAVFIDDNPAERDRARSALPGLLAPEWPQDPLLFSEALLRMRCFETLGVTSEDQQRTEMVQSAQEATRTKEAFESIEDWIASLDQKLTMEPPTGGNQARVLQLINKTNQMNLATRRLTDAELSQWLGQPGRQMWAVRMADKFGDSGLVGVVSVDLTTEAAQVVDFLLSCRVIGRKIEDVMLNWAATQSKALGKRTLKARHVPSGRNEPCLNFLKQYPALQYDAGQDVFTLELDGTISTVPGVSVSRQTK